MPAAIRRRPARKWLAAGATALGLLSISLGAGLGTAHADAIMQVRVNDNVARIGVGEDLTYTMTVLNAGDEGNANVVLTATILNGAFVPGSVAQPGVDRFQEGCTVSAQLLRCTGGFFDRGESGTVTVRAVAPDDPGEMRVSAEVGRGSNATIEGHGFVDTPVIVRPDLVVTDIDGPDATGDNDSGSYLVTVRNRGGSTATGVRLQVRSEDLPWDFFQVDELDDGSNFSGALSETVSFLTPTVTCTGGSLSANESARVRIRVRTSNVLGSGSGRIRATIDPANTVQESSESNNSRTHTVTYNGGIF
jgi:uncharacterized repeat protein (TIGR01451 family)